MFSKTSSFRQIAIIIICFWLSNLNAQVTEVKYMIKFNEDNQHYDCYLVILKVQPQAYNFAPNFLHNFQL